jgi:VanZ family protein
LDAGTYTILVSTTSVVRRVSLWLPPLFYMAAIFYLSSEPNPLPTLTRHVWDKLLHTVEYAGLAILFFRALDGEGIEWRQSVIATVILVSAYGASDEWHQMFVPMRSADVNDWLTDTFAGVIGCVAYRVFSTRGHPLRRPRR